VGERRFDPKCATSLGRMIGKGVQGFTFVGPAFHGRKMERNEKSVVGANSTDLSPSKGNLTNFLLEISSLGNGYYGDCSGHHSRDRQPNGRRSWSCGELECHKVSWQQCLS
jgi:hypothetical protein